MSNLPLSVGPDLGGKQAAETCSTLQLPRILEQYCDGKRELELRGATLRAILQELNRCYPEVYRCICDEAGRVRQHIHLFVNQDLVHSREGLDVRLEAGDVVSVFPAVSGG